MKDIGFTVEEKVEAELIAITYAYCSNCHLFYCIKVHDITPLYIFIHWCLRKKSTDSPRARVFESRDHLDTQTILKKFYELFKKYKNDILTILTSKN